MNNLEAAFDQALLDTVQEAKKLGYSPNYFLQMLNEVGGLATARRLLNAGNTSEGFGKLWELGRLDLTVEAIVLKPEFAPLFTEEERARARERLREVRYTPLWDQPASAPTATEEQEPDEPAAVDEEAVIPPVSREQLLQALARFDQEYRDSEKWQGWEQDARFKYAIEHEGKRYPVKQMIALAAGISTRQFSGGTQANRYVRERGFTVVRLAPEGPTPSATVTPSASPPSMVERLTHARANVQEPRRAWVFQANQQFDLAGALQTQDQLHWKTTRYADQIRTGDTIYLWEAGPRAGIVAVAHVLTDPAPLPDTLSRAFWQDPAEAEQTEPRVSLQIDLVLPERLTRDELRADPTLQTMLILRQTRGTNFPLTDEEAAALEARIEEMLDTEPVEEPTGQEPKSYRVFSHEEWLRSVVAANPIVRLAAEELPPWLQELFRDKIKLDFFASEYRPELWVQAQGQWLIGSSFNPQRGLYLWLADPSPDRLVQLRAGLSAPQTLKARDRRFAKGWRFIVNNEGDYELAKQVMHDHIKGALSMTPTDAAHTLLAEAGSALSLAELLQRAQARGWMEDTTQMALASALRRDERFLDLGEGLWRLADEATGGLIHAAADARFWRIHLPRHFWPEAREAGAIGISWPIESTNASVKRFEQIRPGDRVVAYVQQGTIGGVGVVTGGPVDVRLAGRAGFPPDLFGDDYHRRLHIAWSDELPEPVPLLEVLKAPEHKSLFDRLRNPNTVIELQRDNYQELLALLGVEDPADEHEGVSRLPDAWPSLATFRDFARSLDEATYTATTLHVAALAFGQGVDDALDEEALLEQLRQLRLLRPEADGTYRLADYVAGDPAALLRLMVLALLLPREGQEAGYELPARAIVPRLRAAAKELQSRETFAPRLGEDAAQLLAWYAEAGLVQLDDETWQLTSDSGSTMVGTDAATVAYNLLVDTLMAEIDGVLAHDLAPVEDQALQRVTELEARLAELGAELLIDPFLVRRILRSLLAGRHVVLSGPPGTGKTELAQRLPTLFWREAPETFTRLTTDPDQDPVIAQEETRHGYLPVVVTATEDWGVRDVVGGIGPRLGGQGGALTYNIQHGHLSRAILRHYKGTEEGKRLPESYQRREVQDEQGRRYRGTWLVIDEFTRAPVDAAFGSLLTTLSGGQNAYLAIPAPDGSEVRVPLPADFRIIGTLNSFDRHFLNQISEALKRRFDFIDIPPPPPSQWEAEQGVAAYQALLRLRARGFEEEIAQDPEQRTLRLGDEVQVIREAAGYRVEGISQEATAALDSFWRLFSVIRLFRQLGTAQVMALYTNLFAGRLIDMPWPEALDAALADTLADQLQVLTRDEQQMLLLYLQEAGNAAAFAQRVNQFLGTQLSPGRRAALLHTLREADEVRHESSDIQPDADKALSDAQLDLLFAPTEPLALPPAGLFARRLRALVGERGL